MDDHGLAEVESDAAPATDLPCCMDPDDQKFLELSRNAKANWLLTKDKALLKLANKTLLTSGFKVDTPSRWAAAIALKTLPR